MTTGEKLQKLRKENNYTQEELAEIMNVSRQSISKWESDIAFPETEKLIALSKLYHCSIDYLLNSENNEMVVSDKETKEKVISKKAYNKKRLPLIISTLGTYTLMLILFFFIWFTGSGVLHYKITYLNGYVYETGPEVSFALNFYSLLGINGDPFINAAALRNIGIFLVAFLSIIIVLSIIYLVYDNKALKIAIRVSNCVFLAMFTILMILTLTAGVNIGWTAAPGIAYFLVAALVILQYAVKPIRRTR